MRERQVDLLINKVNNSCIPTLLGGDFNSILIEEEKAGGASYAPHISNHLEKLIRSTNLMEFSTTGPTFTWCNKRQHDQLIEKVLDRFLDSMDWCDTWRNSMLSEVISRTWNSSVPDTLQHQVFSKLKLVRQAIINWLKDNPQNSNTRIKLLQHQLHALTPANTLDYSIQKKSFEAQLHQALKDEEIHWRQKSRIKWLREGDRNTGYFHACTKARRTFNSIPRIKNSDNEWMEGVEQVAQVALSHFRNKFCSSNPTDISRHLQGLPKKVSRRDNNWLLKPVTYEEVKTAVFAINVDSAPGPDGFTSAFFRHFWHVVDKDVVAAIIYFFRNMKLIRPFNDTLIALIPKSKNTLDMSSLRPISLCNIFYKICTKILVKRMQPIMSKVIFENQSAFVPGRLISENIFLAHEVNHYLKTKQKGCSQEMAIKLDMSGAYDRVEWDYLVAVISAMGFAHEFAHIIMQCASKVSHSVTIEGSRFEYFTPTRGLRQGDPLSPFLFVICMEGFLHMLNTMQVQMNCKGIKISRHSPEISSLFFADDVILFSKADAHHATCFNKILGDFGGLGFKECRCMNLALLAKIGWRILSRPSSLLSKVYKGKYFPHLHFLEAEAKSNSSWGWRSILKGRELLRKGLRIQVGSNTILHALGTPWIPMEPSFSVYGPAPHPSSSVLVSHLFDKEIRMWKAQEVHNFFHQSVAEKILQMNITPGKDT
ncbi:hypothetical protein Cni_G21856 [Canna indica]|uniref:Reverse transcriptase domain-containing protein n=1 Tax=Canna indica TaxID=4628 RepID=A0AAQ3KT67_9LILI|nr:hypothetical protein Cni_G21856 [Canna indica]